MINYRNILNIKNKKTYDYLLMGIKGMQSTIQITNTSTKNVAMIAEFLILDYPELFYLGNYRYSKNIINETFVYPDYKMDTIEVKKYMCDIENIANVILSKINFNNDWEKVLAIHDILCRNIKYHENSFEQHSIVGALIHKKAVCDGIAKSFKYLCNRAGIECFVCTGSALSTTNNFKDKNFVSHAWNKVLIDGIWFPIDVTYDLTISSNDYIRHDYFLVTDKELSKSHKEINTVIEKCNTVGYNFYEKNNLVVSSPIELVKTIERFIRSGTFAFEIKMANVKNEDKLEENIRIALTTAFSNARFNGKYVFSVNRFMHTIFIDAR